MNTYLGRYQLGDWLPINEECFTTAATEVAPTAHPTVSIYKANDTPVLDAAKLAPFDKPTRTGWFRTEVFLGSSYSTGRYHGLISWASGGSNYATQFCFDIVAGGNNSGTYIGLEHYRRPHADYVVGLLDGGTLEFRRNPRAV